MGDQKQKQQFEQQWKKIVDLTGNQAPEKLPKVNESEVAVMFKEISDDREKKARETFKTKLAGILEAKLALDQSIKKGREELEKKEEKEYEELNKQLRDANNSLQAVKQQNEAFSKAASGEFAGENGGNAGDQQDQQTEQQQ